MTDDETPPRPRRQTPSQTVGPFFAFGPTPAEYGYSFNELVGNKLATDDVVGEPIRLVSQIFDGEGNPIDDVLVEIWQANAQGRYTQMAGNRLDSSFHSLGQSGTGTDEKRRFVFDTVKPGTVDERQAPHVNMPIMMRGLLVYLFTRLYFDDETEANANDPILTNLSEDRRQTLIARRQETGARVIYHADLHMQGPKETVFFDI